MIVLLKYITKLLSEFIINFILHIYQNNLINLYNFILNNFNKI